MQKEIKILEKENVQLKKEIEKLKEEEFFSLLLVDIDDFKKFNDKFGHLYGDKILKKVDKTTYKAKERGKNQIVVMS